MFNKGNFAVDKTLISFSAIGVDHEIEQENSSQTTGRHSLILPRQPLPPACSFRMPMSHCEQLLIKTELSKYFVDLI